MLLLFVLVYYNKNKIPRPLIKSLKNKFDGNFKIVNPGKKYRKTDVSRNIFLPNNQLIFLLKRDSYYGLIFKHGGRALITYFVFAEINSTAATMINAKPIIHNAPVINSLPGI